MRNSEKDSEEDEVEIKAHKKREEGLAENGIRYIANKGCIYKSGERRKELYD